MKTYCGSNQSIHLLSRTSTWLECVFVRKQKKKQISSSESHLRVPPCYENLAWGYYDHKPTTIDMIWKSATPVDARMWQNQTAAKTRMIVARVIAGGEKEKKNEKKKKTKRNLQMRAAMHRLPKIKSNPSVWQERARGDWRWFGGYFWVIYGGFEINRDLVVFFTVVSSWWVSQWCRFLSPWRQVIENLKSAFESAWDSVSIGTRYVPIWSLRRKLYTALIYWGSWILLRTTYQLTNSDWNWRCRL